MGTDLFDVRADMVDDDTFWIETSVTRAATVQLHATLELARADTWMPLFCLTGPEGSGKTALAKRVARQAARNVACRIAGRAVARGGAPERHPTGAAAEAMRRARATAADFGHCPMVCTPMFYHPIDDHPIDVCEMWVQPGGTWYAGILRNEAITPGNLYGDTLRQTSLVLVDQADHLLNVSETKRRLVLDTLLDRPNRKFAYVFIGGPKLATALGRLGRTQLIELRALPNDAEFAAVAHMVFGTRDPAEVARLHDGSAGCMGALLHMAALRGLKPPFNVPAQDILRLPPPAPR